MGYHQSIDGDEESVRSKLGAGSGWLYKKCLTSRRSAVLAELKEEANLKESRVLGSGVPVVARH